MLQRIAMYIFLFLLLVNTAFAQSGENNVDNDVDAVKKRIEEKKKKPVLLAGKVYMQLRQDLGVQGEEFRTLEITRAYLHYKKRIAGPLSFNLVTDIGTGLSSTSTDGSTEVESETYEVFVKNAYVQALGQFQEYSVNFQFGMLNTPNIAMLNNVQDLRWISEDYSFSNCEAINVLANDHSADMGVKFQITAHRLLDIAISYTHGEGYKKPVETNNGKALHAALSIMPYSNFYLNLYYKNNTYDTDSLVSPGATLEAEASYFSGGLGWNSEYFKTGVNVVWPSYKQKGSSERTYQIYESWVNLNIKAFSSYKVLLLGRFAYNLTDQSDEKDTYIYGLGAGYDINRFARFAVYVDTIKEVDGPSTNRGYIKTEFKF